MKTFDTAVCFSPLKGGHIKYVFYIQLLTLTFYSQEGSVFPQQTNTKARIFIMTCLKCNNIPQFSFLANTELCLVLLCEK